MKNKRKACVSCGRIRLRALRLRNELIYDVCMSCSHCEKQSSANGTPDTAFEDAQEKYFGDRSAILEVSDSPFEQEILHNRQKILGRHLPSNCSVLEVGPGGGAILDWLKNNDYNATVVEHSCVLAERLAKRFSAKVHSGEFETIDLGHDAYDAFCSFHVIEHVRDPQSHLQKAFEVVKPGGLAFVATPNARSWEQRIPGNLSPNYDSAHLRVFSEGSLTKLCAEAGWTVQQFVTPEYTVGWLRVVSKLLRRVKGEDEEATAGKYASATSIKMKAAFRFAQVLTFPVRALQVLTGGGNELFFVLYKPRAILNKD